MKRSFTYLLLSGILLLAGCVDESYVGFVEDYWNFRREIGVLVALGDPEQSAPTKSSGVMDDLGDFTGKFIRVFAYNREPDTSYATEGDPMRCLVRGRDAWLDGESTYARWLNEDGNTDAIYYPNGADSYTSYDFFACFLDDLEPQAEHYGQDEVSYDLVIGGQEDLMVSYASRPSNISQLDSTYSFSYYSARQGIIPIFRMRHALVRIDLIVKPGKTPGEPDHFVHVDSLYVRSRSEAHMIVAAKDTSRMGITFQPDDTYKTFHLPGPDGGHFLDFNVRTMDLPADSEEPVDLLYLGSFFLAPDVSYPLHLTMSEDIVRLGAPQHIDKLVAYEGGFLPGNRYRLILEVFGAAKATMSVELQNVELEEWAEGGRWHYDEDPRP